MCVRPCDHRLANQIEYKRKKGNCSCLTVIVTQNNNKIYFINNIVILIIIILLQVMDDHSIDYINQWHTRLRLVCHFFVLTTFWRHLWSITEQMHCNLESTCQIYICLKGMLFFRHKNGNSRHTKCLISTHPAEKITLACSACLCMPMFRLVIFTIIYARRPPSISLQTSHGQRSKIERHPRNRNQIEIHLTSVRRPY